MHNEHNSVWLKCTLYGGVSPHLVCCTLCPHNTQNLLTSYADQVEIFRFAVFRISMISIWRNFKWTHHWTCTKCFRRTSIYVVLYIIRTTYIVNFLRLNICLGNYVCTTCATRIHICWLEYVYYTNVWEFIWIFSLKVLCGCHCGYEAFDQTAIKFVVAQHDTSPHQKKNSTHSKPN